MLTPDDLLKIEENAIENVAGQWKINVEELNKAIQLKLATTSVEDLPEVIAQIKVLLENLVIVKGMDAQAKLAVEEAHRFGLKMFTQATGKKPDKIPVSKNSLNAVKGFDEAAVGAVVQTLQNLNSQITSKTGLNVAMAPILQHPAKVARATAWSVNNSSNSAVSKLAKTSGERLTWIAERNGCAHCLAYSGKHSTTNGFPKGLTFSKNPITVPGKTLPHPPLHPHCRCSVEVGLTDDYAEALEREARRSILKAVKLPSESDKVRIEAAQKLLDSNPEAPASVIKYAKKKIKTYELKQEKKNKKK